MQSLFKTTGENNTAIGRLSGYTNNNGSNNTYIGYYADCIGNNLSNSTAIGYNAIVDDSNQIVLGRTSEKIKIPGSYVGIGGVYSPGNEYALDVSGNINVSNNETVGGTLNVIGDTSLKTVSTSGAAILESLSVTNNETVGGTLNVTGDTSLKTVSTSGAAILESLSVTNNETVGGTLNVTGDTSLKTVSTSGAAILESLSVTNNETVGGTLNVTGNSTLSGYVGINKDPNNTINLDVSGNANISDLLTVYAINLNPEFNQYNSNSVVPKSYIDAITSGIVLKEACQCATTDASGNFISWNYDGPNQFTNVEYPLYIDTYKVKNYDRVLVKNQTDASSNGIYVYYYNDFDEFANLTRASDLAYNSSAENVVTFIQYGETNGKTSFLQTTNLSITGVDPLVFTAQNSIDINMGNGLELNGNTLSVDQTLNLDTLTTSGNVNVGGTLIVTSNSTLNTLSVTNNETVGGTLSVTGNTSLSTVSSLGAATLNSLSVTNNETVGGTLSVTGNTSLSTVSSLGAATLNSLSVTNNETVGGTLSVTGNTLLSTVSSSGAATLNSLSVTNNETVGGTLSVTGNTSLSTVSSLGAATLNSLSVTNNETVGGTLSVTGNTLLSTVSSSGAATLNSLSVTNNETVGGTLSVTGNTLLSTVSSSGAATLNSLSVTNNETVGGTLSVTGNTLLSTVSSSGAATLNSLSVTNNETVGGTLSVTGNTSLSTVSSLGAATLNSLSVTNNETVGGTLSVTGNTLLSTVSSSGAATLNSLSVTGTATIGTSVICPSFLGNATSATNVALTIGDDTSAPYYIPFSKTTDTTSNKLYIDNTTTPLTYNPNTSTITFSSITPNNARNISLNGTPIGNAGNTTSIVMGTGAGPSGTMPNNCFCFGSNTGQNLTSGIQNLFIGTNSGNQVSTGRNNTFLGASAGRKTTSGSYNTQIGGQSQNFPDENFTGSYNTTIGGESYIASDGLSYATAIGAGVIASASNTIKIGRAADTTIFDGGIIVDTNTLYVNATNDRVGIGNNASENYKLNVTGSLKTTSDSIINGITVGKGNLNIDTNTIVGTNNLLNITTTNANNNTAFGYAALQYNSSGNWNTAVGVNALQGNTTGSNNVAIGVIAGCNSNYTSPTSCSACTFVGNNTTTNNTAGYNNSTALGYGSQITANNQIVLGTTSEKVFIPKNLQIGRTYSSSTSNALDVSGNISTKDNSNGYLELINGTTLYTGYVRFYNYLGSQCGFIGFGNDTSKKLTLGVYSDIGYTGWECGEFTVSNNLNLTKSSGNVVIGNKTSTDLEINNFVSGGSYIFRANTTSASSQTIMRLSSGTSEGLVEVTGNVQLTSRAGGSAAIITNSSSGILTIQNTASSSSTQIINEDSGGISRTNLILETTKQTIGGNGTDFNVVLTGDGNSTTGKTMRILSSSTNMYIDCGTGYTTGSAPLLFRTGAGVERMRMNDYGLIMNNTCIYGRNDGYNFTILPSGALTQPIGFVVEYNESAVTFTDGGAFTYTTVLPALSSGVWQVNGNLSLFKGTATYDTNSFIRVFLITAAGVLFYPSVNNGSRIEVSSTSIVDHINVPLTSTLVVTGASVKPGIQGQIQVGTLGTATKALNVVFVKIA